MKSEFLLHNLFKKDVSQFLENDPHLSNLKNLKYVHHPSLEFEINLDIPGIYILTGGRQVGKSTLLKFLIKNLLTKKKVSPERIYYIPCDLLERYQDLVFVLQEIFDGMDTKSSFYLFLDEITYVKEWDRAIKYFADLGYFTRGSVLITGSDSVILKESMKKFPGRRGRAERVDFHYYPISFFEYLTLLLPESKPEFNKIRKSFDSLFTLNKIETEYLNALFSKINIEAIYKYFEMFLLTGGFLTAINSLAMQGKIDKYVYRTYQQWVIGDLLKRNKKENFLREIILTLSDRIANQVSIHSIAAQTEIEHHATVQEYLQILNDMDVLFIQYALREEKLAPALKKAKKIHFTDPFIAQALITWAKGINDPWTFAQRIITKGGDLKDRLVEGSLSSLMHRNYPTFYIKGEGEVDIALLTGKGFLPIEIKWSESLKRGDLKQILKYKSGIIGYKGHQVGRYGHLLAIPVPLLALLI